MLLCCFLLIAVSNGHRLQGYTNTNFSICRSGPIFSASTISRFRESHVTSERVVWAW